MISKKLREVRQAVKTRLRMKCPNCGHWIRFPVNKLFIEQETSEPKVKVYIPMYEPLEVVKCKKCSKIIAEPKELIRIAKR
jgi:ribosomal protein S27E